MIRKSKLKLLYIHNSSFDSEVANSNQVGSMCREFVKLIDTSLLAIGDSEKNVRKLYSFNKNISLVLLNSKLNYHLRSLLLYKLFLIKFKDVNYVYTRDLIIAFLISKFHKNIKVIYEVHEIIEKKSWNLLFKNTFSNLHKLIVISNGIKFELEKKGFNINKIEILHDGVDLDLYSIKESKIVLKRKYNFPMDKKIIFYAGSLQNWKGITTFLNASNYCVDGVKFIVAGGDKNEVKKLKEKYSNVLFLGQTPYLDLPKYLKASDFLILPNSGKFKISINYTSPLKLFSYLASKRLIISSDLPSIREVVSENEVIFFRADSAKDLAKQIDKVSTKGFKKELISNSYKLVKKYTWKKRAKVILELFEK